ncbi:hypothetical protein [Alcanivorax sp.]|uniref:hypothetical protein n=1 Tax=Alcanivorax sp. TaxID=1872427 RepID=UPI00258BE667|nr:hypothetical protein [Alcanivorax sp.]
MSRLPVRHYCTYFDSHYLARGLVLHQSLEEQSEGDFLLYVLCLDDRTHGVLDGLDRHTIVPVRLSDVEAWDPDLLKAKGNRSLVEYYFTLSPVFPLYVLEHFKCEIVTYLDADLMFFSSPEAIFEELGGRSILITEHRFSDELMRKGFLKSGRFNVQCQCFRKDEVGYSCLYRWREQCLAWCYDRHEGGKFADQKYLDDWPGLYGEDLVVSRHPGIGLAPWNVANVKLGMENGRWQVNGRSLVFYHFHGLRNVFGSLYRLGLAPYDVRGTGSVKNLYTTYIKKMRGIQMNDSHVDQRFGRNVFRLIVGGIKSRDLGYFA